MLTPHSIYTRLGINKKERQLAYRGLFAQHIESKLLEDIRKATNKGLAVGNECFFADIESLTGRRVIEVSEAGQWFGARTKLKSKL